MNSLLSREEALFFLGNAKSLREGINRISEIYSDCEAKGLVITFSFTNQDVGFTHIMIKEGFLRLTYDGRDNEGLSNYNESKIVFTESKDLSFIAEDYRILKMLADSKSKGDSQR